MAKLLLLLLQLLLLQLLLLQLLLLVVVVAAALVLVVHWGRAMPATPLGTAMGTRHENENDEYGAGTAHCTQHAAELTPRRCGKRKR